MTQDGQGVVAQLCLGELPEYREVLSAPELKLVEDDNEEFLEAAE